MQNKNRTEYPCINYMKERSLERVGRLGYISRMPYGKHVKKAVEKLGGNYQYEMISGRAFMKRNGCMEGDHLSHKIPAQYEKVEKDSQRKLTRKDQASIVDGDLKKGQKEFNLNISTELFRVFVETASDLMCMTDKYHNFTYVNKASLKTLGYSKKEMIGMNVTDILGANRLGDTFKKTVRHLMETGKVDIESTWVSKCGKEIYGEEKILAVYDSHGNFVGTRGVLRDNTKRKEAENHLKKSEKELRAKALELQELNTALKILLRHREEDKVELEEKVLNNVKQLIEPYLEKLKKSGLNSDQQIYFNILMSNLKEIISPFTFRLSSGYVNLTPSEIKIANLVRLGKTSKDIAEILFVSPKTVGVHRENIRKKLGIDKKNANLRSHLFSFRE